MKKTLIRIRNWGYGLTLLTGWLGIPLIEHHSSWYLKGVGIALVTGWSLALFYAFVAFDIATANEGL